MVLVHQMDGAGVHNDKTFNDWLNTYQNERGWLSFRQPSQSPITNVHDACVFPMMSRAVSKEQANAYGSQVLKSEELHRAVMTVWNDDTHLVAMSRAFAAHHQIVCAIMECEGDNNYLNDPKGMTFGVRRTFVATRDGDGVQLARDDENDDPIPMGDGNGVEPIDLAPQSIAETLQGFVQIQNRLIGKLKFEAPDLRTLNKSNLSREMEDFLLDNMTCGLMTADVEEYWLKRAIEIQNERNE